MNVLLDECISINFEYAIPKLKKLGYKTVTEELGDGTKDNEISTHANLNNMIIETNDTRLALHQIKDGHMVHYVDRHGIRKKITPTIEDLEPYAVYHDKITKSLLEFDQVIRP